MVPTIDDAIEQNSNIKYLAFSLAAWAVYINKALTNNQLNDPLFDAFSLYKEVVVSTDVIEEFLILACADKFNFIKDTAFMQTFKNYYNDIINSGIEQALNHF